MSERIWTRRKILENKMFLKTMVEVTSILGEAEISYALVGGIAVAVRANPPVTIDSDFLVDTENVDILEVLFRGNDWSLVPLVFANRGPGLPKYGFSARKRGRTDVDLISTSGDRFLEDAVSSATVVRLGSVPVKTVTADDLIVMKTLVGRDKDLEDTIAIRRASAVDETYIERQLMDLES